MVRTEPQVGSSPNLLAAALCTCFTQNEILASARDEVIKALPEALSLRIALLMQPRGDDSPVLVTYGNFLQPGLPQLGLYSPDETLAWMAIQQRRPILVSKKAGLPVVDVADPFVLAVPFPASCPPPSQPPSPAGALLLGARADAAPGARQAAALGVLGAALRVDLPRCLEPLITHVSLLLETAGHEDADPGLLDSASSSDSEGGGDDRDRGGDRGGGDCGEERDEPGRPGRGDGRGGGGPPGAGDSVLPIPPDLPPAALPARLTTTSPPGSPKGKEVGSPLSPAKPGLAGAAVGAALAEDAGSPRRRGGGAASGRGGAGPVSARGPGGGAPGRPAPQWDDDEDGLHAWRVGALCTLDVATLALMGVLLTWQALAWRGVPLAVRGATLGFAAAAGALARHADVARGARAARDETLALLDLAVSVWQGVVGRDGQAGLEPAPTAAAAAPVPPARVMDAWTLVWVLGVLLACQTRYRAHARLQLLVRGGAAVAFDLLASQGAGPAARLLRALRVGLPLLAAPLALDTLLHRVSWYAYTQAQAGR
ncbi:hypothetical protein ACKKBG_A24620 [Auxenochlorella protothecoides x Auxenochlorella symbiontica]